jgi:putative Ca2+/H+ antiporter (TMEM165/GDT1 family)
MLARETGPVPGGLRIAWMRPSVAVTYCRAGASPRPARPDGRGLPVDLVIPATVFGVVFLAELPDKTALASLILGSRYRPVFVFAGVAAAFAVHVALAVTAGSLLGLLPRRAVEVTAAVLFAVGAAALLRGRPASDEHIDAAGPGRGGFWRVAATSFTVILVAEFGDLTQVLTAGLAARDHAPLLVGAAAMLALWAVAGLAIAGGRGLLKVLPLVWITRAAAVVMFALAAISAASAFA